MIDNEHLAHDLTLVLLHKNEADTPEKMVAAYNELLPKVKAALPNKIGKAAIFDRRGL